MSNINIKYTNNSNNVHIRINDNVTPQNIIKKVERDENAKNLYFYNDGATTFEIGTDLSILYPNLNGLFLHGDILLRSDSLNSLTELRAFSLIGPKDNKLPIQTLIPFCTEKNRNLINIRIANTKIDSISEIFFDLYPNLQIFELWNNNFTEFPHPLIDYISSSTVINTIDLSGNNIKIIPYKLFSNHTIENINLSDNPICKLPRSLLNKVTKLKLTDHDNDFGLWVDSPHLPRYMRISGYLNTPKNIKAIIRYFKQQDELEAMDPELRREIESLEEIDIDK